MHALSAAAQKAKQLLAEAASREEANRWTHSIAALLLLRDLRQMGWELELRGPTDLHLVRISRDEDVCATKQRIRDSMLHERSESLRVGSVRTFVRDMERPASGGRRSVLALHGDGGRLHRIVKEARRLARSERPGFLRQHIRPYLQLIEGEQRDSHTNQRLIDIWRYFRLTWSTPYRPTPGRNLFYLVRDAAQETHPVIGIAALGNVVIGLKCRDDRIGWTPGAIAGQLQAARQQTGSDAYNRLAWEVAGRLERYLAEAIGGISWTGLTTANEVTYPSEEGIRALESIADDATRERYVRLRQEAGSTSDDDFQLALPFAAPARIREDRASYQALFRRKRAQKLATLLRAKLLCQQNNVFVNPPVGLPHLLWNDTAWQSHSEAGRSALRCILLARKDACIGSAMMEITVCGAVAPYSYLLGGKLVAILLASPQVVTEYRTRYAGQASTIASQMAGREVLRAADLVFLGTSSLYAGRLDAQRFADPVGAGSAPPRFVSASQYNRLRIPASALGGDGAVEYESMGITQGYGVVHFSTDTREALEALDVIATGARRVNSIFGEGTSPRMRKIRQGISLLGLDERFLIHGQARLVYGIRLAHNTERYLLGVDAEPEYILPQAAPQQATEALASHWIERWLSSRVDHQDTLERIGCFRAREHAVSREYGEEACASEPSLFLP